MTNKLARIAALALTFAAVSPVLPRIARACGGYGSQSATPSRAVYRYVYALRTNAPALASELWAPGAHASRPVSSLGCCAPGSAPPLTPEAWVRGRLGDRTYAVERIDAPQALADGTVRVQLHSVIDRVRAVETLTLRSIEGEWRIAELSSRWA